MLTEDQKNKYLGSPYLCPYCGSDELSLGKVSAQGPGSSSQREGMPVIWLSQAGA